MATERPEIRIGGHPANDLVFDQPMVSGQHARIVWDGRQWVLEDLGSTNGTFVAGRRIQAQAVSVGDVIGLGTFTFTLEPSHLQRPARYGGSSSALQPAGQAHAPRPTYPQPPQRTAPPPATQPPSAVQGARSQTAPSARPQMAPPAELGPPVPSGAPCITIGAAEDNDIVVPLPQLSGHHCRLWLVDDKYIAEDLGSSHGVFVRGQRVHRAYVSVGEPIGLGSYRYTITDKTRSYFAAPVATAATMAMEAISASKPIKVGRDDEPGVNDIVVAAPMVSSEHCEIQLVGNQWRVRDLGSTNGTFVNSHKNRITEAFVTERDVLFFGSYRFPMSRMAGIVEGQKRDQDELRLAADKNEFIIGRDDKCDVTIDAYQVSRRHARLRRTADGMVIEDLGSANGTFVRGARISRPTPIGPQDWVGLGSYQVRFDLDSGTVARNYQGDIMIQALDVVVKVDKGRKTLLKDVSFTVFPTEFVGLMGPSGAGKTTLMMALNGYFPPTTGRSLVNHLDLYRNYDAFRGNIGYVPQDDIIHGQLTVWEALYYTARLRLPPDTSKAEIGEIIMRVLRELEIEETRDVLIGSPEKKGISGGQRKRVNLAQELITQPSLLFLDEPTSGLASEDTLNVMRLLRRLADQGRTILLTIHQPSLEAYRTMDNIVYLADGELVYYGPAYPDSITYFNPQVEAGTPEGDLVLSDPGNALKPLAEDKRQGRNLSHRAQAYKESSYHKEYVVRRRENQADVQIAGGSKRKTRRRFGLRQWWTLSRRYFTIVRKDLVNTTILLLQAPIIGTIIAGVFWDQTGDVFDRMQYSPFALFLLAISSIWFGCSNSAREIVSELAIYRRERMVNLKIPSYVMSKFTVLGLLSGLQCFVLLLITYLALDLQGNFIEMYAILVLCAFAGLGMGLTLSALVRTAEAAVALVPLLLIPQVIMAGLIMPIGELVAPMKLASYPMAARWGYEALLHIETASGAFKVKKRDKTERNDRLKADFESECKEEGRSARECQFFVPPPLPPKPLEQYFEDEEVGLEGDTATLAGFNLLLLLGIVIILKIKDPESG